MASRISPYVDNTGLVFAYDLANVNRSYLGQPTVNLIDSINFTTDYNTSWNAQENIIQTKNQVNPKGVVDVTAIKIESNSVTDNFFGVRGVKFASSGTNHTFSFWAKGNKAYNNFPIYFGVAQVLATVNITTEWKFFAVQTGAGVTFTDHTLHLGGWGSWTDNTFDLFLWHPQLEQKPHPTPFTTGTRSVTQGLRDLTGNSTIDLTNVSFDGNAQMTFDGTDDYVDLGSDQIISPNNQGWTAEYVFNTNSASTLQHFNSAEADDFNANWLALLSSYLAVWDHGQSTWRYGSTQFNSNRFYHIAFVQTTGTTMQFYVNGIPEGGDHTTFSWSSNFSSLKTRYIGQYEYSGGYGRYFNGSIPYTRLYSRALPAPEILQNFNAIKGRYGL